jgi:ATP-dependent protease ClpP protease subunit
MNKDLLESFSKKGCAIIIGKIDRDGSSILKQKFVEFSKADKNVIVLIDSPGGDMEDVWGIVDFIRLMSNKVIGIVIGRCSSAAFYILQACDIRLATPNSHILVHHITSTFSESFSKSDSEIEECFRIYLNSARADNERIAQFISKRTGHPLRVIKNYMDKGSNYRQKHSATEALKLNFIDAIVRTEREIERAIENCNKLYL